MTNRQIFGRQPVVWIAAIQAVLTLLVSFHALKDIGINGPDDVMLVAGVLNAGGAVYLAFGTTEAMLAALVELFKGGAAFAAIYGLNLTGEQSGVAVLAITAVFSLVVHQPKTSPQATLSLKPGPVLVPLSTHRRNGDEHGSVTPSYAGVVLALAGLLLLAPTLYAVHVLT